MRPGQGRHRLWIDLEYQSWTFCSHVFNVYSLFVRHVSQVCKYYKSREKARKTVHNGCNYAIPKTLISININSLKPGKYITCNNYCGKYYSWHKINAHQIQHQPNRIFVPLHLPRPEIFSQLFFSTLNLYKKTGYILIYSNLSISAWKLVRNKIFFFPARLVKYVTHDFKCC